MKKGVFYENKAEEFLLLKGYKILKRNFSTKLGEIDIIAQDKKDLVFVEVRKRGKNFLSLPSETVDKNKRRKIILTAKVYLSYTRRKLPLRFDVVGIVEGKNWRIYRLIKNAFSCEEIP